MSDPAFPDVVVISVKAIGPGPPAVIRVRKFLKSLLRAAGLRAVRVEPGDAAGMPAPPTKKEREDAA